MVIAQGHISFPSTCGKMQTKGILVFETHNLVYIWRLREGGKVIIFPLEILLIAFSKYGLKHKRSQKCPDTKWTWHHDLLSWHNIWVGIPSGPLHTTIFITIKIWEFLAALKLVGTVQIPFTGLVFSHVKTILPFFLFFFSFFCIVYLRNTSSPQILNNIWVFNKLRKKSSDVKVYQRDKCFCLVFFVH